MTKERTKFVLEWEKRWNAGEGQMNFSELCREFGISRQQGYVWLQRFREANHELRGVAARSHRPHTMPTKVEDAMEEFVVALRRSHPTWGPKKLRAWILHHHPQLEGVPAPSTIGEILRRRGITTSVRRRRRASRANTQPFASITGPNATWCVDFKGHFRTGDGVRCYPLTIIDAYSRFLVRCENVLEPDGRQVQRIFDEAFQEFGLPAAIRSDNGPPFASVGAGGLTPLSVWWLRLGIQVERITPGKPQQNGRQERPRRLQRTPFVRSKRRSMPSVTSTTKSDPTRLSDSELLRRSLKLPPDAIRADCSALAPLRGITRCESTSMGISSGTTSAFSSVPHSPMRTSMFAMTGMANHGMSSSVRSPSAS